MTPTRQTVPKAADESPNDHTNGFLVGATNDRTDYSRWRLLDESGRHTWHYLKTDKEIEEWPQSVADKYHLGLPTVGLLASRLDLPLIVLGSPRSSGTHEAFGIS